MQNNPQIEKENINRFLCEKCDANMVFDPKIGKLACPYCQYAVEIETDGEVNERDYNEFIQRATQNLQPMARDAMQVSCSSCGAIVNFTPPETATQCDFCGAKIVAQAKAADPLVAPEGVLPFSVPAEKATAALNTWLGSLWFAPGALKEFARPEKLSSIYIPYWTYDPDSESDYDGERGDYYYETEHYTENGEEKSREVRHTQWRPVSGHVSRQFDDVLIPATKSLPQKYLDKLSPWDFSELRPYEPAFLSGHKAQTYQVPLDEGFEGFKRIPEPQINGDCRSDIGGDEQRVVNLAIDYSEISFKHLLLPIYAGAYRFNDKVFQIVVNGRTGEVQGGRPYSWLKIGFLVAAIIGLILIVIMLFSVLKK